MQKEKKGRDIEQQDLDILYTFVRMKHTEKEWEDQFRKHLSGKVTGLISDLDRKETISRRDILLLMKKVQHSLGTGLFIVPYNKEDLDEVIDEVNKEQTKIIQEELDKEFGRKK